jgi:hypothetical protein
MANYKRKHAKKHLYILCCRDEALRMTGNHPGRRPPRDLRQPAFYSDDNLIDPFELELAAYEAEMEWDWYDDEDDDWLNDGYANDDWDPDYDWWWYGEGSLGIEGETQSRL